MFKRGSPLASPASSEKKAKGGYGSLITRAAFVGHCGKVSDNFPQELGDILVIGSPHRAQMPPRLEFSRSKALIHMLSQPVAFFANWVLHPATREKARYLLVYSILSALATVKLSKAPILVPTSVEELLEQVEVDGGGGATAMEAGQDHQRASGLIRRLCLLGGEPMPVGVAEGMVEKQDGPVAGPRASDPGVSPGRLLVGDGIYLGHEENIEGVLASGPVEFILLHMLVPRGERVTVRGGLRAALEGGCVATMLLEMKAAVNPDHFWQPLAAAMDLAVWNFSAAGNAHPVSVVLTDAIQWYFFTVQYIPEAEPGSSSAARTKDEVAVGNHRFRLYDGSMLAADILKPPPNMYEPLAQVFARLYDLMFPGSDVAHAEAEAEEGRRALEAAAARWSEPILRHLEGVEQEAARTARLTEELAHATATAAREAEARVRAEQEAARAEAARAREAEARAREAEARVRAEQEAARAEAARARAEEEAARAEKEKAASIQQISMLSQEIERLRKAAEARTGSRPT